MPRIIDGKETKFSKSQLSLYEWFDQRRRYKAQHAPRPQPQRQDWLRRAHEAASDAAYSDETDPFLYSRAMSHMRVGSAAVDDYGKRARA